MITKDMLIAKIVEDYPATIPVLMGSGMGCLGCAISHAESLEQGATAHGIDADALVAALNEAIK